MLASLASAMHTLTTFLLLCAALATSAAPPAPRQPIRTNAILPSAHFDAAESVFRTFLADDRRSPEFTNTVFFAGYGPHDSELPREFLTRFYRELPLVTNSSAATIKTNFTIVHSPSGRTGIGLALRELRLTGDTGEARLVYVVSGGSFQHWRVALKREARRWQVSNKTMESISCP